jgi:septum formation protein
MSSFILASGSFARQGMLKNAGFVFDTVSTDFDEDAIKNSFETSGNFEALAQELAKQKALHVSTINTDQYVIGSDQLLVFNGAILSKAKDTGQAREKLKKLRGHPHALISSVCVTKGDEILFQNTDTAHLTMRDFDDDFLERYCDGAGDIITQCVGAYALESTGIQLFSEIKGDYFTILGMPLLPLVSYLQSEGVGL